VKNEQAERAQTIISDKRRPRIDSARRILAMEMRGGDKLRAKYEDRDYPRRPFDGGDNRSPLRAQLDHSVLAKTSS
jgi:hypothetical protein